MAKMVVTTFYVNGQAVWRKEFPGQLDDEQIKKKIKFLEEDGHGKVDAVTDTTGRMIQF